MLSPVLKVGLEHAAGACCDYCCSKIAGESSIAERFSRAGAFLPARTAVSPYLQLRRERLPCLCPHHLIQPMQKFPLDLFQVTPAAVGRTQLPDCSLHRAVPPAIAVSSVHAERRLSCMCQRSCEAAIASMQPAQFRNTSLSTAKPQTAPEAVPPTTLLPARRCTRFNPQRGLREMLYSIANSKHHTQPATGCLAPSSRCSCHQPPTVAPGTPTHCK